jgi:hypothetical protein
MKSALFIARDDGFSTSRLFAAAKQADREEREKIQNLYTVIDASYEDGSIITA